MSVPSPGELLMNRHLLPLATALLVFLAPASAETKFKPVRTQFLAALGDPQSTSGVNADTWGLWQVDPGPRGVRLSNFPLLVANGGVAPSEWIFEKSSWWLEENGLIMEPPNPGVAPGQYMVTGDREVMAVLTVHPKDGKGKQRWELSDGATLYDVTHLRCRSARYTPESANAACTPASVAQKGFPVTPGAAMPPVSGCKKEDHAVLFIVGVAE